MDKKKIIEQITSLLQNASVVQCDLVLTFIKHLLNVP